MMAFVEAESLLNSRPLATMSNDPSDLTPLTPNHFIVGRLDLPLALEEIARQEKNVHPRRRWMALQVQVNNVWRRWQKKNKYTVHLPWNLLIISIVHKKLCLTGFWRLDKERCEIASISFPSMEADGRKSLCIITRDKKKRCFIGSGCHWGLVPSGGRCRTNGIYLLANYVLTNRFCMELMLIRQGPRNFYVLMRNMYWAESY